ncbi:DNA helicase UvrD, partial [Candidatus Woesearchaeota archaeon]|nr:DNA helicase UvrD [Candidatus Woesearchaeota archaeon]
NAIPFKSLISLSDILSAFLGTGVATQKVSKEYNQLVKDDISEFNILLDLSFDELKKLTDERIAAAIIQNREGKVKIKPGYDGVYGVPMIGEVKEEKIKPVKAGAQKGLEDFYR